jgi:hypothetical protein
VTKARRTLKSYLRCGRRRPEPPAWKKMSPKARGLGAHVVLRAHRCARNRSGARCARTGRRRPCLRRCTW